MSKNIVICSDGTGNSFGRNISNVARMVGLLALADHRDQIVVYDQGIGTDARRWTEIDEFHRTAIDCRALEVLPGPHESWFRPWEWLALLRGLAFGDGIEANVCQMYQSLAKAYESEDDRIYLFGFSRGAFTVRALAGLIYRCGLPRRERAGEIDRLFEQAWQVYLPLQPDWNAARTFREKEGQRQCAIYFLGLWDTVKSYGGLQPVMLPHLRHNPIVHVVRHALALDEQRGWFDATTWGRLDIDQRPNGPMSRLTDQERGRIMEQDIDEVWFRGCHSDVGGGSIALRWMLAEAAAKGIILSDEGERLLRSQRCELAEVHDSHSLFWRLVERLPRNEIDNSGKWPQRTEALRRNAPRQPGRLLREGMVSIHESVALSVRVVRTGASASAARSAHKTDADALADKGPRLADNAFESSHRRT